MQYKVVSLAKSNGRDTRVMIDELRDKIFDELSVRVVLDISEVEQLLIDIIKDDTQIDLKEYDIPLDYTPEGNYGFLIEDDMDLTPSEKKHIIEVLTKKYSKEFIRNAISSVLRMKANTEHYSLEEKDNEDYLVIEIPLDDFNIKSDFCKYLFMQD